MPKSMVPRLLSVAVGDSMVMSLRSVASRTAARTVPYPRPIFIRLVSPLRWKSSMAASVTRSMPTTVSSPNCRTTDERRRVRIFVPGGRASPTWEGCQASGASGEPGGRWLTLPVTLITRAAMGSPGEAGRVDSGAGLD